MKLILNADDFGLTECVNLAIVECMKAGTVGSTTVMMNQPGTKHAIDLYHQGLVPEIGLHFTLTSGRPLSPPEKVSSLIDNDGFFLHKTQLANHHDICADHVATELMAQYQAALDAGFKINHIDSHHFAGVYPEVKQAFTQTVNDIGLPVRRTDNIVSGQQTLSVPTPVAFESGFFDHGATLANLKTLLSAHKASTPSGIVEFMCHPAREVTQELTEISGYCEKRVVEWKILTNKELINWLEESGIECVGYRDL